MKRLLISAAAIVLTLSGCASGPVPPDWQANAHAALKNFTQAYLAGNTRLAMRDLALARDEVARTGRPDLLARVELTRCAVRVAALEFDDCPGFQSLAADASAPERAYADFLAGRWEQLDAALLPAQHRALLAKTGDAVELDEIADPVSRLVAAGVLFRLGRLSPKAMAQATDTASAQGWRRPLMAWLGVQLAQAQKVMRSGTPGGGAGDTAAALQRRIDMIPLK